MRVLLNTVFVAMALFLGASRAFSEPLVIDITLPTGSVGAYNQTMKVLAVTTQPIGHHEFCKENPGECRKIPYTEPTELTQKVWAEIQAINVGVNRAIKPMTDIEVHGKDEVWSYVRDFGDCEDYVLEKRYRLIKRGIPASNLLITVVRKSDGEGHALLTLRAKNSNGLVDLVLDNLTDEILPWQDTYYRYLKRQSASHAGKWVSIHDSHDTDTTAAN